MAKREHKPMRENFQELFGEYFSIMTEYMHRGLFREVVRIGNAISYDVFVSDIAQKDIFAFCSFMLTMAKAQHQCVSSKQEITDLLRDIDFGFYYDEDLVPDDENFRGQILCQKAVALHKLSRSAHLSDETRDRCWTRAVDYINEAVEIFAVYPGSPKNETQYLDVLCDRSIIYASKSLSEGRKYVIDIIHNLKDNDDNDYPLQCYHSISKILFDQEYNPEWIAVLRKFRDVAPEVLSEVTQKLAKMKGAEDFDEFIAKTFTHAVSPENRQSILIVDDILDVANLDLDEVQQVFTSDQIPYDITFNGTSQAEAGVYVINPENTSDYMHT